MDDDEIKKLVASYEKKTVEIEADPFEIKDSGAEKILTHLKVSALEQKRMNYTDEKVRKILMNSLKQHCVEIGYTFDEGEERYHKLKNGDTVIMCLLSKSIISKRRGIFEHKVSDISKQKSFKQIFGGK